MEIVQPGGTGGGGSGKTLTPEIPVGTIDGSNTIFTVIHQPVFVEIDGMLRIDGYGYTFTGGTITTDALGAPVQNITSFYNA